MTQIYFDNSATTRPSEKALSAMMPFFTQKWGVPSAPHKMGAELFSIMEESYRSLYQLLGADEKDTILFTSSGAEAVNQAIMSAYFEATLPGGKNHFLYAAADEAPSIMAIERLEEMGCVAKTVPIDSNGRVTADALAEALTPRTAMLTLSWGNGLTGTLQALEEVLPLCRERGVLLHLDASHVVGKYPFEARSLGVDFLSFSGDLFHAPKGTGGLYVKEGVNCRALIAGGLEQGGLRGGAVNVASLAALGQAAKEALESRDLIGMETARLRSLFEERVTAALPDTVVFFQDQERLPHISAMAFPGVANEALLFLLAEKGIAASMGGGSFQQLSLQLQACGIGNALAQSAVSFSLSRETTEEEVEAAVPKIIEAVELLKKISEKVH